jgi:hypothetical protein
MRKTYLVRIEIFNASNTENKLLQKHLKRNGFKKVSKDGITWEISKPLEDDLDLPEIYSYVKSVIEKIEHSSIRVTTEFEVHKHL